MQRMGRRASSWIASGILFGGAACAADTPPDIEGIWTSGTLTPFERPAQVGAQLPEAQRAEQQRIAAEKFWAAGHKPGEVTISAQSSSERHRLFNGATDVPLRCQLNRGATRVCRGIFQLS